MMYIYIYTHARARKYPVYQLTFFSHILHTHTLHTHTHITHTHTLHTLHTYYTHTHTHTGTMDFHLICQGHGQEGYQKQVE